MNSSNDRETPDYTASEYAKTILDMLRRYDTASAAQAQFRETAKLVSHIVCLEGGKVGVDEDVIRVSLCSITVQVA